ncbi:MAG: ATP-binding protein, partial [Nocardioidaceae bacterium]
MPAEPVTTHPLVGRTAELGRLCRLTGIDGSGPPRGAVLVAGDAGVGKTRLLRELGERARDADWRVLVGHCLDFGDSALPYLPFTEVFGDLAVENPEAVESLADELPAVRRLLPRQRVMWPEHESATSLDRGDLLEAVHRALESLAGGGPLLVVVEDVHWADPSTRELLTFLFTRRFAVPVALVVSYRSDDLHRRHPLRTAVAEWSRLGGVTRVNLPALADADVRALVHTLHPAPMTEVDMDVIIKRSEGNAFFTEELVGAAELGRRAMPDDLAELMLIRLDRLEDDARVAVRAASAAGRRVTYELLARVAGIGEDALDAALRQSVERHVLVPAGNGYAFRHALLGEAVYEDLLPGERVRLHGAYADALRSREVGGTAADLARHARAAHDLPTAVHASIEAGDDAMSVGGPDDAARHYQLALELVSQLDLSGVPDVDVVDLTVKAGDSITAAGSPHRAVGVVREQLNRLSEDLDDEQRVRLLLALALPAAISDTEVNALELTTEAFGLVGAEDTALRAQVLSLHARVSADRLRDDAARWAGEAVRIGEQLGLPQVVADATTTLGRLDVRAGDPEASKRVFQRVISQARATDDALTEMRGLHQLAGVYFESAEFDEALRYYRAASDRAAKAGRPWAPYGIDGRMMASITAYMVGDWDLAWELGDVTGQAPPGLAEAGLTVTDMVVSAGRGHAKALDLTSYVRPWWRRDGVIAILGGAAEIDLHGDKGDIAAARAAHGDAVETVAALWQWKDFPAQIRLSALLLGQLATHAAQFNDAERKDAAAEGERLLQAATDAQQEASNRCRPLGPEGVAWQDRAQAEELRLRWLLGVDPPGEDRLLAAWEAAVASFEEFGHVFELARSRARLAAVLRALGRRDDARTLVEQAREVAERLKAEPLLAELRTIGAAPA